MALVVRMPGALPLPVNASHDVQLVRFPPKRDFGITIAVVTAIVATKVGATTSGIAVGQTVATAHTVNKLSTQVAI